MRNHKEDTLQEHCVRWFKYSYPDITILAIPNGGSRNAIEAAKLKRTGTLAGVADLFVMKRSFQGEYLGLFIELKTGTNQQTPNQIDFMLKANLAGYYYTVCRSIDEFIQIVNEYLS